MALIQENNAEWLTTVPLQKIRLKDIVHSPRTTILVTRDSYYCCSQHNHKNYDWDGCIIRYGEATNIPVDGYIPLKLRQPAARMDLPKVVVDQLTAMVFGHDKFPEIKIEGDVDAEDYVQELANQACLETKIIEARNNGGATGTAVLSWGFINGKPTIDVHKSEHCEVLEWENYEERKPLRVLKTYTHQKKVWDKEGRPKWKIFYYVRYWDDQVDVCWDAIPEQLGATQYWWQYPSKLVRHETGICPVYWIQNRPSCEDEDGIGDYDDGSLTNFDQIDILLSSIVKGTIANVDPTLVIHSDRNKNDGFVRKGSDVAIYSKGGAKYLELQGSSIEAATKLLKKLRQYELDKAGVVLLDAEKAGGTALSASAMRQMYATMIARADILREQYSKAIIGILKDMLETARNLQEIREDENGVQYWSKVELPPKVVPVKNDKAPVNDIQVYVEEERVPGTSSNITLSWPPYFTPTWQDRKDAVTTAQAGTGGKPVLSRETAVGSLANQFGIDDVEQELKKIDKDTEEGVERAQRIMDGGAPPLFNEKKEEPEKNKTEDKNENKGVG